MNIHPKTSGATFGGALGILIGAILHSIPGVHLVPEVYLAIPAAVSAFVSWLTPATPKPVPTRIIPPAQPPQA